MTEVSGFGQGVSPPNAQSKGTLSGLAKDFDNFLLLLTTQLQHQDPLSPLDTNEFTNQIVQFTGVEQAINTNRKLDELIGLQWNNQAIGALSFLGTTIEASGDQIALADGRSEIRYALKGESAGAVITILDASGKPVRVAQASAKAGENSFTWDGTDNDGGPLPDGPYSVQIIAVDGEGETTEIATPIVTGQVTGVEIRNGEVILDIGGIEVPANLVRSVQQPPAA